MQTTVTLSDAQTTILAAIAQRRDAAAQEYSAALTMAVAGQLPVTEGMSVVSVVGSVVTLDIPERA